MSKRVPAGLWFDGIGKSRNPNIHNVYDLCQISFRSGTKSNPLVTDTPQLHHSKLCSSKPAQFWTKWKNWSNNIFAVHWIFTFGIESVLRWSQQRNTAGWQHRWWMQSCCAWSCFIVLGFEFQLTCVVYTYIHSRPYVYWVSTGAKFGFHCIFQNVTVVSVEECLCVAVHHHLKDRTGPPIQFIS
jgi:hypothetical protein